MFLIRLNNIKEKNTLDEIYKNMSRYNLYTNCYLNYISTSNIPVRAVDFLTIKAKEFIKNKDCSLHNLKEKLKYFNVILDVSDCEKSEVIEIESILEGLKYRILQERRMFNIDNITFNDLCIIKDLLEVKHSSRKFSKRDFNVKIDIFNNGDLYIDEKEIGNIFETPLVTLITSVPVRNIEENIFEKSLFGDYLYEPWSFLNDAFNSEDVINYKLDIFDKLKDLSCYEMLKLPEELRNILAKNYYIRWNDIIEIISRKDWVLNEFY